MKEYIRPQHCPNLTGAYLFAFLNYWKLKIDICNTLITCQKIIIEYAIVKTMAKKVWHVIKEMDTGYGECVFKSKIIGKKCDKCVNGFFGFPGKLKIRMNFNYVHCLS